VDGGFVCSSSGSTSSVARVNFKKIEEQGFSTVLVGSATSSPSYLDERRPDGRSRNTEDEEEDEDDINGRSLPLVPSSEGKF
jgi:hypothetical protein